MTKNLLALNKMSSHDWETALMSAYDKGHIRFELSPKKEVGLAFGDMFVAMEPYVLSSKEYSKVKSEADLRKVVDEYSPRLLLDDFILGNLENCSVDMTTKLVYLFVKESLNIPKDGICRMDNGDVMVDTKGSHYHVAPDGKKFRTVHDTVKAFRDGSFGTLPDDDFDKLHFDYEEFCPKCNTENYGTLDARVGLVGDCEECGERHLICIMCDNRGWGCVNCPEAHLKATPRY